MKYFYTILLLIALGSCSEELGEQPSDVVDLEERNQDHYDFLAELGFDEADIEEYDSMYILEGDIRFQKKDVDSWLEEFSNQSNARTQQQKYSTVLTSNHYIYYYINSSVPSSWISNIVSAGTAWNDVYGCDIYFSRTYSSSTADITFSASYTSGTTVIASANYPHNSSTPGKSVIINTYYNYLSDSKKKFAMAHELGHTVGLCHTDESSGTHITQTPYTDNESVMNSTVLEWSGFSGGDKLAFNILFTDDSEVNDAISLPKKGTVEYGSTITVNWTKSAFKDNDGDTDSYVRIWLAIGGNLSSANSVVTSNDGAFEYPVPESLGNSETGLQIWMEPNDSDVDHIELSYPFEWYL